jgi:hypothetical protein
MMPHSIEPGQCPEGIVVHVYDARSEELLIVRNLRLDADVSEAALIDGFGVIGRPVVMAFYDGDDGDRLGAAVCAP